MKRPPLKNVAVLGVAAVLAALGSYNIFLKATWTLMDDGVLWVQGAQGVYAARVAPGGPAAQAGIHVNDIVLALDGEEVLTSQQIETHLSRRPPGAHLVYDLLRADERRPLEVTVKPLSQGNVSLFYYLSLVGFFSLLVGTIVMLRRPPDRAALHFYAICLLFFLMYSTSYTGKLNLADWTLLWADHLSILFLPVVFLHFCLSFPERRLSRARAWMIPAAYMPALALAGAAVASQVLFVTSPPAHREVLWQVTSFIDNWKPIYFATLFAVSFGILLGSYRRTRSLTARKQMKWLVWGTGTGVLPFFLFYAIPFGLGREPRLAMELAGYFIAWLIVAQALVHLMRRQRAVDALLITVAAVLVGRTVVTGGVLSFAELVAIALVVPVLVPLSRLTDRTRCAWLAVLLIGWLVWIATAPVVRGDATFSWTHAALEHFIRQPPPAPQQIIGKAFNYLALGWLLVGAGLLPHIAAGLALVVVVGLCVLEPVAAPSAYGWADLAIALLASIMVARWMPTAQPRSRAR